SRGQRGIAIWRRENSSRRALTMRKTTTAGIFGAMLVVLGAGIAEAGTVTVRTPSIIPDADGYVYCRVEARGPRPLEIVAKVVTTAGDDVTEFGTGFPRPPRSAGLRRA